MAGEARMEHGAMMLGTAAGSGQGLRARSALRALAGFGWRPGGWRFRRASDRWPIDRAVLTGVLSVAALVLLWLAVGIFTERLTLSARPSKTVAIVVELASALARLFGAIVIVLLPARSDHLRFRWVGIGFLILGLGQLAFGAVAPMLGKGFDATGSLYAASALWGLVGMCCVVGLAPKAPPPLSIRSLLPFTVVSLASLALLSLTWASLPELVADRAIPSANANHRLVRPDGPLWYWLLALSPVGLTVVTAVIATVRFPGIAPRGWLAVALTLLAGAQVHNAVWPSTYATVLTSASMLRLAFSLLIVAGAILEFRRIAAEYEAAIDSEREYARRLSELAALRADFTSMVSHEIGSPLAAIRAYADILDQERFDAAIRQEATATIRDQVDHLRNLVHDIATIATIESDHFDVRPFEIPLNLILADGAAFAASLPGNHPFICSLRTPERIVVDPVRIAQVLRNLLGNAANYSPPGTPIELRTERVRERVRIEVVDHGYGIPEDDLDRIFEKFGRSSADYSRSVSGTGLGLYISRRIVEAHGSRLTVSSKPGVGSVFGFEIEVAR